MRYSESTPAIPMQAALPSRSLVKPSLNLAWPLTVVGVAVNVGILVWAYWPALMELVATWIHQPDYAHGFVVLPLALFFLYCRRDSFPGWSSRVGWFGLSLLVVSLGMRVVGWKFYLSPLEGWSLVVWVAGATWLVAGWQVIKWSWPAIAFLIFLVPLPYSLETSLSLPLQQVATLFSSWGLQLLGEPALAEGNTVYLAGQTLEVAPACSGLSIFMTSLAMGSAVAILCQRHWFECLIVTAAAVPIAMIANSMRIVLTGLLLTHASDSFSVSTIHSLPGWLMIPLTAVLFGVLILYLNELMPTVRQINVNVADHQSFHLVTSRTVELQNK